VINKNKKICNNIIMDNCLKQILKNLGIADYEGVALTLFLGTNGIHEKYNREMSGHITMNKIDDIELK
jgi:hypothetical protein